MVRKPSHADGGAEAKERKGLWSPEEDERLYAQITHHGVSTWSTVAQLAGLRRSGKSCRLRWMNYLRPDLKKEPISKREEETIISLQKVLGNRWSVIAARMPGRTDNEIKNYWNSRIRKRHQNVDAGGCTKEGDLTAKPLELRPAGEKESVVSAAAAAPPVPARLSVFACQMLGGGGAGDAIAVAGTQSTTTHEQKANSVSEVSFGSGGEEDARDREHHCCAGNGDSDSDLINLLSFDDLDQYPVDLLMDVPGVLEAWESELYYCAKSSSSLNC